MLLLATAAGLGCGGDSGGDRAGDAAPVRLPVAGRLWVIAHPENRAQSAASLAALVHGVHVLLVNGDDAYGGVQHLPMSKRADGSWSLSLPSGSVAHLERTAEQLLLRLPGAGEVAMVPRAGSDNGARGTEADGEFTLRPVLYAPGPLLTRSAQVPAALDEEGLVLAWHKATGVTLDAASVVARAQALQQVPAFDRPDSIRQWKQQLEHRLAAADISGTFRTRVQDRVSEYDHDRQQFALSLFEPGSYLPLTVFGEEYRVVFANAESARYIRAGKDSARVLDAALRAQNRSVLADIAFSIAGAGDPAGAVTGGHVIRAALTDVRVLDGAGQTALHHLALAPTASGTPDVPRAAGDAGGATPHASFDSTSDVAGFRVGIRAADFEQAAARLFGAIERRAMSGTGYRGYANVLLVNEMGCMSIPGRRHGGEPGAVCVTAFLDRDDVVRAIRMERVFPFLDGEAFREVLLARYGPVADASKRLGYTLGWGPAIDSSAVYEPSGPRTALTATWTEDEDMMSRSLNALPRVRVTLQLTDAAWIAAQRR